MKNNLSLILLLQDLQQWWIIQVSGVCRSKITKNALGSGLYVFRIGIQLSTLTLVIMYLLFHVNNLMYMYSIVTIDTGKLILGLQILTYEYYAFWYASISELIQIILLYVCHIAVPIRIYFFLCRLLFLHQYWPCECKFINIYFPMLYMPFT